MQCNRSVSPTYDWGLPSLVEEFLKKVSLRTDYLYLVSTVWNDSRLRPDSWQTKPYRGAKSTLYYGNITDFDTLPEYSRGLYTAESCDDGSNTLITTVVT